MKKVYCVIFSVMLVVFTMIPVTAFAGTGAVSADYKSIAQDAGISIPDNYSDYVVYIQSGVYDYVYCAFSSSPILIDEDSGYFRIRPVGESTNISIVRYSYDNVYSNPISLCSQIKLAKSGIDTYCINPYTGVKYDLVYASKGTKVRPDPVFSNYDFNNAGTTFQQTPSGVQPGTEGERPGVVLGATMKKTELSQVLSELVALLPILVPVLISFIAIRKGLRFTLSQLRVA